MVIFIQKAENKKIEKNKICYNVSSTNQVDIIISTHWDKPSYVSGFWIAKKGVNDPNHNTAVNSIPRIALENNVL